MVHRVACNPGATSFEHCFDEYMLVTCASIEECTRLRPRILAGTMLHAQRNVTALIHAVRHDVVPLLCRSAKNIKVRVSWQWLGDFSFPFALSVPIERSHFGHLALKCLQTLATPSEVSDPLIAALDANVPLPTPLLDRTNEVQCYPPPSPSPLDPASHPVRMVPEVAMWQAEPRFVISPRGPNEGGRGGHEGRSNRPRCC